MRDDAAPLPQPAIYARERISWLLSTAALALLYLFFAGAHLQQWRETGYFSGLGIVAQETLIVALFVMRRPASRTSHAPLAWLATAFGAFGVLALQPGGEGAFGLNAWWRAMQLVGVVGSISALGFLGRSFGVVPAYRGLRTGGPYRLLRHPAYASYLVAYFGYLFENPTWWNATVLVVATAGQLVRIHYEEALLSVDPAYIEYRARTRWRLVPFVY
jgi:protein-S-isoprenylcysteine O-methyltransferase Ste14